MDRKICGKLITLHRRGNGVDVEALHDRIPSSRSLEKAPRWDLTGTKGCDGGKVVYIYICSYFVYIFNHQMMQYISPSLRSLLSKKSEKNKGKEKGKLVIAVALY